jgi:hypothetical protein
MTRVLRRKWKYPLQPRRSVLSSSDDVGQGSVLCPVVEDVSHGILQVLFAFG